MLFFGSICPLVAVQVHLGPPRIKNVREVGFVLGRKLVVDPVVPNRQRDRRSHGNVCCRRTRFDLLRYREHVRRDGREYRHGVGQAQSGRIRHLRILQREHRNHVLHVVQGTEAVIRFIPASFYISNIIG